MSALADPGWKVPDARRRTPARHDRHGGAGVSGERFSYDPVARLLAVGERRYPAQQIVWFDIDLPTGGRFNNRVIRVVMENGYQLSAVWGSGTYSTNHDHSFGAAEFVEDPLLVECAVISPAKEFLPIDGTGDIVAGYCSASDVQRLIDVVSQLSTSDVPESVPFMLGEVAS